MGSIFLAALKCLFGEDSSLSDTVGGYMKTIFEALYTILVENEVVSDALSIFGAIVGSLIVFRFITDAITDASREMLSLHRFAQMFVKTVIVTILAFCIPQMISGIFGVGYAAFNLNSEYNLFTMVSELNTKKERMEEIEASMTGNTLDPFSLHGYEESVTTDTDGIAWENDASRDNIMFNFGGWVWSQDELDLISPSTTPEDLSYEITADPCGTINNKKKILLNDFGDGVTGKDTDSLDEAIEKELDDEESGTTEETLEDTTEQYYNNVAEAMNAAEDDTVYKARTSTLKGTLNAHYGLFKSFLKKHALILVIVPALIKILIIFICLLECLKIAIEILVKAVLSPIAIANSFGEGKQMTAIHFLKGFLVDCLAMAFILLFINAGAFLSQQLMLDTVLASSGYIVSCETLNNIFDLQGMLIMIVPELAVLGGVVSSKKLAGLVVGEA